MRDEIFDQEENVPLGETRLVLREEHLESAGADAEVRRTKRALHRGNRAFRAERGEPLERDRARRRGRSFAVDDAREARPEIVAARNLRDRVVIQEHALRDAAIPCFGDLDQEIGRFRVAEREPHARILGRFSRGARELRKMTNEKPCEADARKRRERAESQRDAVGAAREPRSRDRLELGEREGPREIDPPREIGAVRGRFAP
jgi:hypothetical protein